MTPPAMTPPAMTPPDSTPYRTPPDSTVSEGDGDTGHRRPPVGLLAMLRNIGPGLIVAGSIVGSGELIATTKTGAEAGFVLLWLILLGCVVKVFVQVELGRYAIISGKTTLQALDEVPGPRVAGRGNWLVWYWLLMWLASISQLGGIVGGVGQALAIALPIAPERGGGGIGNTMTSDAAVWAGIVSIVTSGILIRGRYGLIQTLSTILVASFTLLTIANLYLLQGQPDFAVTLKEFWHGLSFGLPERDEEAIGRGVTNPVGTALATFGIIGVGAAELVVYPYWCLEKGYAKFVGVRPKPDVAPEQQRTQWDDRAAGWMRVMRVDAWGSMVVYTFATLAFYLLGAGTLWRLKLNPAKDDLIATLAQMYVPVFGSWASAVFLFGAFAVLYSTYFVAIASHARTFSDALRVIGAIRADEVTRDRWVIRLSGLFPLLCWTIYVAFPQPAQLVLISGIAQGIMLPMLAAAAIYFRYRRMIDSLRPTAVWDIMLWISAAAMLVTGMWTVVNQIQNY